MIGEFGPPAIRALSYHTHVPTTFMFMGSFGAKFNFSFTELGGLRLITDNFVSTVAPTEISMNKINKQQILVGAGNTPLSPMHGGEEEEEEDIIVVRRSSSWSPGGGLGKEV